MIRWTVLIHRVQGVVIVVIIIIIVFFFFSFFLVIGLVACYDLLPALWRSPSWPSSSVDVEQLLTWCLECSN